mmetsp:Transcript_33370/g.91315  ORF Transcript_33370/g.91315 Transcript_33370/m.91315 type:complete len:81 (+) Transcript_33370:285-527(+)|eukprot:6036634-Prymnesium_polylepis.1
MRSLSASRLRRQSSSRRAIEEWRSGASGKGLLALVKEKLAEAKVEAEAKGQCGDALTNIQVQIKGEDQDDQPPAPVNHRH